MVRSLKMLTAMALGLTVLTTGAGGVQASDLPSRSDNFYKSNRVKYIVPGANHVDLYDRSEYIPFEKLTDFFKKNLK